jgi:hypothetical protein
LDSVIQQPVLSSEFVVSPLLSVLAGLSVADFV